MPDQIPQSPPKANKAEVLSLPTQQLVRESDRVIHESRATMGQAREINWQFQQDLARLRESLRESQATLAASYGLRAVEPEPVEPESTVQ